MQHLNRNAKLLNATFEQEFKTSVTFLMSAKQALYLIKRRTQLAEWHHLSQAESLPTD